MKKSLNFAVFFSLATLLLAFVPAAFGVWAVFSDSSAVQTSAAFSESGSELSRAELTLPDTGDEPTNTPYYRYRSAVSEYNSVAFSGNAPSGKSFAARVFSSPNLTSFRSAAGNVAERFALGLAAKTPRYLVLQSLLI